MINPATCLSGALLCLVALLSFAAPADAQDELGAEALFNRGLAEMEAGRYEAACPDIGESQRLDPRPGTLFTLATCEARWGRVATAFARFGEYLALYETMPPEQQERQATRATLARKQREKLGPELPMLTLSLPPGTPSRTVIARDGAPIPRAALGRAIPVDPGEHVLTTQLPGGEVWRRSITVARGEKKEVTLHVKQAGYSDGGLDTAPRARAAASEQAAPSPPAPGPSKRRVAAYVTGGVGLAGLAVGAVLGGLTLAQKGTVEGNCAPAVGSTVACNDAGFDAAQKANRFGLGSTVAFGVGGAAVVTAALLFFTEPRPSKVSAGARGRGLSARVLAAGPEGAALGVQGTW
jgi:hypothetical protein